MRYGSPFLTPPIQNLHLSFLRLFPIPVAPKETRPHGWLCGTARTPTAHLRSLQCERETPSFHVGFLLLPTSTFYDFQVDEFQM